MDEHLRAGCLFYSFHTKDEFYSGKAQILSERLQALGLDFRIDAVDIPDGAEWPDICRSKIEKLYAVCTAHPDRKVFWIDVDCYLTHLPPYVEHFAADIIGFQRGFSSPDRIGYLGRARFWEPCFLGINRSPIARKFIEDAFILEQRYDGKATDDYFFEESWRINGHAMSFQVIPSRARAANQEQVSSETFFVFGASGHVREYAGRVTQHDTLASTRPKGRSWAQRMNSVGSRIVPEFAKPRLRRLGVYRRISLDEGVRRAQNRWFRVKCVGAGKRGDADALESIVRAYGGEASFDQARRNVTRVARALCAYRQPVDDTPPVRLAWWINPPPGNVGDWLSPYILKVVSGRPVEYCSPLRQQRSPHYFAVGSIGRFVQDTSTLLGTGISRSDADVNPNARVISLRGPLTGARLRSLGGHDPEIYGDPAILLPKLFQPGDVKKSGKVGLVRHYLHKRAPLLLPSYAEEIEAMCSCPAEIEQFIRSLHECDYVLSSALHPFILCQAYGIPCGLVNFSLVGSVPGDGTKYEDYFRGVGLPARRPIDISANLRNRDLAALITHEQVPGAVVDRLYGVLLQEFGDHGESVASN